MTIWDCAVWEPSGPSKVAVAKLSNLPVVDWDAPVTVPVIVNVVVAPAFNAPRFLHTSPAGTLAQSVAVSQAQFQRFLNLTLIYSVVCDILAFFSGQLLRSRHFFNCCHEHGPQPHSSLSHSSKGTEVLHSIPRLWQPGAM